MERERKEVTRECVMSTCNITQLHCTQLTSQMILHPLLVFGSFDILKGLAHPNTLLNYI